MGVERINLCILLWDGAITGQIALPWGTRRRAPLFSSIYNLFGNAFDPRVYDEH